VAQTPTVQTFGETQSAVLAQVVLQAPVPQTYGAHELVAGVAQVPLPSHAAAGVRIEPLQAAPAQGVPDAYFWQAPLPLQNPLVPQVVAPASLHWLSGSVPAGTATQVPTEPVRLHALHVPAQAVAQQTPCVQKPELQVVPLVQAVPLDERPQLFVVVLQVALAAQSVLLAQVVLQAVPAALQAKGAQLAGVAVLQVPAPSQVRAAVAEPVAQVAGAQAVPAT
jgi:hypothetical protein